MCAVRVHLKDIMVPSALALASLTLVAGCGATKNTGDIGEIQNGVITMVSFTVAPPDDAGWDVKVNREAESVEFATYSEGFWSSMRGVPGTGTYILVAKNPRLAKDTVSEAVSVRERFEEEVQELRKGEASKEWELKRTKEDTATVGGKHLHVLYVETRLIESNEYRTSAHYLYYPADFAATQTHYEFFIGKTSAPGGSGFWAGHTPKLDEIIPVIQSFRYRAGQVSSIRPDR